MKLNIEKREGYVALKPEEEKLDSSISPQLKSELLLLHSEGFHNMIIDLNSVTYVDSSGLSALLVGNRLCGGSNGKLVLTGVGDFVRGLLQISRLDSILAMADTMDSAITELGLTS